MSDSANNGKTINFAAVNIFIVFLALYLLTTSGYGTYFADVSQSRTEVAKSIVERGDLSIPDNIGMKGADGRSYSWFGLGPALLVVPLHLIGKLTGIPTESLVSFMNPLVGAATTVLVFLFAHALGYARRASISVAFFYGMGTMAWYYAKAPGDHAVETLCILLSIYNMYLYGIRKKILHLVFAAITFGFAMLVRPTSVLALPSILVLMFSYELKKSDSKHNAAFILKDVTIFAAALCPFTCLQLWYNHYRFSSIFESGYTLIAARTGLDFFTSTPFLTGFSGLLISPGKGFFLYAPVAVLFFFSIRRFSERHPDLTLSFILMILLYPLFYAKNIYWHGDWTWGPRYIFVTTPFYVIPIASLLHSLSWQVKRLSRIAVCSLFFVSFAIQFASVSVFYDKYFRDLQIFKQVKFIVTEGIGVQPIIEPPYEIYFDWEKSPIPTQFGFMWDIARNINYFKLSELPRSASPLEILTASPYMHLFDFWWVYKYFEDKDRTVFIAVIILLAIIIHGTIILNKLK